MRVQQTTMRWGAIGFLVVLMGMLVACGGPQRDNLFPPLPAPQELDSTQVTDDGEAEFAQFVSCPLRNKPSTTNRGVICARLGGRCARSCGSSAYGLRASTDCARVGGICCIPKKPSCRTNADCGGTSCRQSGSSCLQAMAVCYAGRCYRRTARRAGSCNASKGVCEQGAPACRANADCGKPQCKQNGTMCEAYFPACDGGQCTVRRASVRGTCEPTTGVCTTRQDQCAQNQDCGRPTCFDKNAVCYQLTPTCQSGQCRNQYAKAPGACNSQTGKCEETQPVCRANADCGQTTCKQNGSSCVQYVPTCTNGQCSSVSSTKANMACNSRNGQCEQQGTRCVADADCGKSTCSQNASSCVTYQPKCVQGYCSTVPATSAGTCDAATGTCKDIEPPVTGDCGMNQLESEVLRLVNVERGKAGLSPLACNAALVQASRSWSQEQCNVGRISHDRFSQRIAATGVPYSAAGENVAAGQTSAAQVMNSWMNSSGHRKNIMSSSFTHIGVGYFKCNRGYVHFWTQMFIRSR